MAAVAARPLAELLECPAETGNLLTLGAETVTFDAGQCAFRQDEAARGLYVVVSGEFLRRTERMSTRMTLGTTRPGELVELAAALGGTRHTYTLSALTRGTLLLLPSEVLHQAFDRHPPLRMKLLEELAREVSRAYFTCLSNRPVAARRRVEGAARE